MPTIPLYNQGATEEAGLTRAKRRVLKALNSGIAKLTDKPDVDLTNGSADLIAKNLIGQFEDLTALCRQVNAFLGDGQQFIELDTPDDAIKALRLVIITAKATARILRTARMLSPIMRFMDLGILSDLKAVQSECVDAMMDALRAMNSIDFSKFERVMDDLGNYEDPELSTVLSEWDVPDNDLDTVISSVSSDTNLGSKRSGSTSSKSGRSGSTISKRTPKGSALGVPLKQGRINTMFRYMFGAAEDLRNADVSMSLDRPPPRAPVRPRVRGRMQPVVPDVPDELDDAVRRGERMAQQEEEEFQMRQQGLQMLEETVEKDKRQQAAEEALLQALNEKRDVELKPFKRFGLEAFRELIGLMSSSFSKAIDILNAGYNTFNAYRQQQVLPARAADADVGNSVKTGNGLPGRVMYPGQIYSRDVRPGDRRATQEEIMMRGGFQTIQGTASNFYGVTPEIQNIYRVGGSSNILYEREGLPRFL